MVVKLTWRRRAAAAAFLAAGTVLLVSCGQAQVRTSVLGTSSSGRPWWYRTGISSCGPPALVRLNGRVMAVGDCAGYFLIPAQKAIVRVGQEISVHMVEEPAGPPGSKPVPVFPLPRSSRVSVLANGAISPDRATGTYRAVRPGQAVLVSRAWCLAGNQEISGSCPVIDVTVLAAASLSGESPGQLVAGPGPLPPR
jgi:hypothetical protein